MRLQTERQGADSAELCNCPATNQLIVLHAFNACVLAMCNARALTVGRAAERAGHVVARCANPKVGPEIGQIATAESSIQAPQAASPTRHKIAVARTTGKSAWLQNSQPALSKDQKSSVLKFRGRRGS